LGLSLLAEAARMSGGDIKIESQLGIKTSIEATFVHSNIDRKPLGDVSKTLTMLIAGNPDINFLFVYKKNHSMYSLDTMALREHLNEVPLNYPEVIKFIRDDINQGMNDLGVVFY
jgi:hypothetical protein